MIIVAEKYFIIRDGKVVSIVIVNQEDLNNQTIYSCIDIKTGEKFDININIIYESYSEALKVWLNRAINRVVELTPKSVKEALDKMNISDEDKKKILWDYIDNQN